MSAKLYEVTPRRKRRHVEQALIDAALSQVDLGTKRGPGKIAGYVVMTVHENGAVNRDMYQPVGGSRVGGAMFRSLMRNGLDILLEGRSGRDAACDLLDEQAGD